MGSLVSAHQDPQSTCGKGRQWDIEAYWEAGGRWETKGLWVPGGVVPTLRGGWSGTFDSLRPFNSAAWGGASLGQGRQVSLPAEPCKFSYSTFSTPLLRGPDRSTSELHSEGPSARLGQWICHSPKLTQVVVYVP